jgi:hypothetical protein
MHHASEDMKRCSEDVFALLFGVLVNRHGSLPRNRRLAHQKEAFYVDDGLRRDLPHGGTLHC